MAFGFDWDKQWFQAPFSGTYLFSISGTRARLENLGIYPKASIFVHINRNNVGEAISSENTSYVAFSFQFTNKLNAGDKKKAGKSIYCILLDECWNRTI